MERKFMKKRKKQIGDEEALDIVGRLAIFSGSMEEHFPVHTCIFCGSPHIAVVYREQELCSACLRDLGRLALEKAGKK